ncbi:uncharacterized protein LOC115973871 [Quercus lobata]|uniref:uncharacterized protein LOC115973871 n=1 Tax=Quercus lobata TaxID=97700 RepID=UPI0012467B2D|nr:uncharacterized protein LOC115973871 [Quercus lobata]
MGRRRTEVLIDEGSSLHEWVKSDFPYKMDPIVEHALDRCTPSAVPKHYHKIWTDQRRSPSSSNILSNDEEDGSYRRRSRTPLSETFSYEDEHCHRRRHKGPSSKGLGNDAMNKALDQISKSPFTHKIEGARLPRRFHQPTFTIYNGRMDLVEHVSQFNQRMAIHSQNEALMCKVFPSSLGLVVIRWFNSLKTDSIDSYRQLTQAFSSRFITNSRAPLPLTSLLSLSMASVNLWIGLTNTKEWKRTNCKGKERRRSSSQKRNDFRLERYNNNHSRRDFAGQSGSVSTQTVNAVFREPVHQVLEKVKNEPFFKWPNKMDGDSIKRNQSLYCQYHQDHEHTIEDCRNLWNHLDQLVREEKLRHLLHPSSGHPGQTNQEPQRNISLRPPMGTINVILATPGRTDSYPSRIMSVARLSTEDNDRESKKARKEASPVLGFLDEDKIKTIQPHNDALLVTLRIRGFDVKRVLVDQGSAVEVMYLDLYRGLNLKLEDLTAHDSPLVSFEGKTITPRG